MIETIEGRNEMKDNDCCDNKTPRSIFPLLFLAFVLMSCGWGIYEMNKADKVATAQSGGGSIR